MRFKLVLGAGLSLVGAPLIFLSMSLATAGGCKGNVIIPGRGGSGSSGTLDGTGSSSGSKMGGDAGKDAFDDYMDPPCKNPPKPITDYKCPPYSQGPNCNLDPQYQNTEHCCAADEGCYIFVDYPSQPCAAETYGAVCAPAGPGGQGAACMGPSDCVAGASCVITGSGNQCVMLCQLMGPSSCPDGTVCEPIDVSGTGGCL